jgi:hypothetical protein
MNPCKMETGLDVGHTVEDYDGRKTDTCIIDVDVYLELDVTKGYWHFVGYWCNLIHDNVCCLNDCGTVLHHMIVFSFSNDDTLGRMTKIWRLGR